MFYDGFSLQSCILYNAQLAIEAWAAAVAQRIALRTADPKVPRSNPRRDILQIYSLISLYFIITLLLSHTEKICNATWIVHNLNEN